MNSCPQTLTNESERPPMDGLFHHETYMDTTTLLIIVLIILFVSGGWYGRGRWC